jgi:hypothetical protein
MDTQHLDRDREFAIVDSTEEFETPETTPSDDFQPAVSDFEDSSSDDEYNSGSDSDFSSPEGNPETTSQVSDEPSTADFSSPEPQEKTPSQQSFRVMRFEDFVNQGGN